MKILCLFALVGLAAASTCPPEKPPCPDLCDYEHVMHPFHDCYIGLHKLMKKGFVADCKRFLAGPKWEYFHDNLKMVCTSKNKPPTECCDDCDFHGQPCFEKLDVKMQGVVEANCRVAMSVLMTTGNKVPFEKLMKNLDEVCHAKCLEPLHECPCHECDFTHPDHPTHDCWMKTDHKMQKVIYQDCVHNIPGFWPNIKTVCESKHENSGPMECCDHCDFDGLGCFDKMDHKMQHRVEHDCCAAMKDEDKHGKFLDNIATVCESKEEEPMCPCMCDFSQFACYENLNPRMKKAVEDDCESHTDPTSAGYWKLLDNLKIICEGKWYSPMFPCPEALRPILAIGRK